MFRREERELAARLARVLDGQEQAKDELATLVTVLERATEPARFELSQEAVERELARTRPRLRAGRGPDRRPGPRLALAFGAVAAAAVALVVFTFVRVPGIDVEGKALAALGGGSIFKIEEQIEPVAPGAFPTSSRTVWLDPERGRERWYQLYGAQRVEEVLVEPGRISRLLPLQKVVIVTPSCRGFAGGCAAVLDPVAFYRRALEGPGAVKAKREGSVYRLTLPVQTLPDAVRIEQRVTIDAKTFLPRQIEWLEQRPGEAEHPVSRIVIESIRKLPRANVTDPFHLPPLTGIRVEQRDASSVPLRKLAEQQLSLVDAKRLSPSLLWLGPSYAGMPLTRIDEIRWNSGTAYRLHYGSLTVWNYTNVIPPDLVSARLSPPAKTIPLERNVGRFYEAVGGRLVADLETPGRSAAVISPAYGKIDLYQVLLKLRPLR